jgi:hypothetical protein
LPCAFWFDLWLGTTPLDERFLALFSHSIRPHATSSFILSSGVRANLGPRLTFSGTADLRNLTIELATLDLRHGIADTRVCRLTNKLLSNKDIYSYSCHSLGGVQGAEDHVAGRCHHPALPQRVL